MLSSSSPWILPITRIAPFQSSPDVANGSPFTERPKRICSPAIGPDGIVVAVVDGGWDVIEPAVVDVGSEVVGMMVEVVSFD